MSRFLEAQAAADRAQEALEEAEQLGLSSKAIEELEAERDRTREYADKGVLAEINAETVARAKGRLASHRKRNSARDRYYGRQDPDTYQPAHVALDGDCLVIGSEPFEGSVSEQPPKWFRLRMPKRSRRKKRDTARPVKRTGGNARKRRKRGTKSRSSSSDDPGDREPPRGLDGLLQAGVPLYLLVLPAEVEPDDG